MAELKTRPTDNSVTQFIDALQDKQQKSDSHKIIEIMSNISGEKPVLWGTSIIGFGTMHLKYASGRDLDWLRIGFSPRKDKLTLYITMDAEKLTSNYKDLGKFKTGKGCIYIKRLSDVDEQILTKMISVAYKQTD